MTIIDEKRLAEIEARAKLAAPGPWSVRHRDVGMTEFDDESCCGILGLEIDGPEEASSRGQFAKSADARFIAHAREDVPDLVAAVRERDARIKQLEDELRESNEQDAVGRRLLDKATDTINELELQLAEAKG